MTKLVKCEFYVEGMHCAGCELLIEEKLSSAEGIVKVEAKLSEEKVYLESRSELNAETLSKLVEEEGYTISENPVDKVKNNKRNLLLGLGISIAVFAFFLLLQKSGIVNLASGEGEITISFIFLIGIIASLSTCMAVVGGLVLSLSSNYAKDNQIKPMIFFHISRLIGFFILGGVIGLLGSAFTLTPQSSFILNVILFVVMLILAVNLLGLLPKSKNLQLKMPKFVGKGVLSLNKNRSYLTPLLLGALTFFLPCGFTQSMQLYSLTTGSFVNGALTMFIYALGTLPVLALISFASTKLSKGMQSDLFFKTAGFIVILFALFNFTASLSAVGIIPPIFNI